MTFTLHKSTRMYKKYMAIVRRPNKKDKPIVVHFGDSRYQQFKDSTPLGLYTHLDHGDFKRRRLYYARHGIRAKPYSAKWFSHRFLW